MIDHDAIVFMAREAGMSSLSLIDIGYLEKFAALVAAAEREACAMVCEAYGTSVTTKDCAALIRARSQA